MTVELSFFNRLEPRPRDNDLEANLAAETRDPLWFLARQWQMGEFAGEDTGSLAYARYSGKFSTIPRWVQGGSEVPLLAESPLERQTLREPFTPDLGLKVELGHDFRDFLATAVGDAGVTADLVARFGALERFAITKLPDDDPLNPPDAASQRFLEVCAGRTLNGYELLVLGRNIAAGTETVPGDVTTNATRIAQIEAALASLAARATAVFGDIGPGDPATWTPDRLEYAVEVVGVDPAGHGNARLAAHPDSDGEYDWYSFDVTAKNPTAVETAPTAVAFSIIPARVRFTGMPAPRFWAFEENTLPLPDLKATSTDDLVKLIVADFITLHANDWHVLPYEQKPGTLAWTDWIIVRDVFDRSTVVRIADPGQASASPARWGMYRNADRSAPGVETLADYFLLPQTAGPAMQLGSVLEDVRFGRDEMANMAFAIEHVATSPIGEPHPGRQRDAEVDASRTVPPAPPTPNGFALRYEVESEIPASWVPLLAEQPNAGNPSIELRRGANTKAIGREADGTPILGTVLPQSKVLKPEALGDVYRIKEEEIPRAGLQVQRIVYRTRWTDGSTHLWVQRRRRIGAGESSSGLRFDRALPNKS